VREPRSDTTAAFLRGVSGSASEKCLECDPPAHAKRHSIVEAAGDARGGRRAEDLGQSRFVIVMPRTTSADARPKRSAADVQAPHCPQASSRSRFYDPAPAGFAEQPNDSHPSDAETLGNLLLGHIERVVAPGYPHPELLRPIAVTASRGTRLSSPLCSGPLIVAPCPQAFACEQMFLRLNIYYATLFPTRAEGLCFPSPPREDLHCPPMCETKFCLCPFAPAAEAACRKRRP
jgi:hypothetical protein